MNRRALSFMGAKLWYNGVFAVRVFYKKPVFVS